MGGPQPSEEQPWLKSRRFDGARNVVKLSIDTNAKLVLVRVGDSKCAIEQEAWNRGTLAECNEHFVGRIYWRERCRRSLEKEVPLQMREARRRAASKSDPRS
jgi:hypothetical protein